MHRCNIEVARADSPPLTMVSGAAACSLDHYMRLYAAGGGAEGYFEVLLNFAQIYLARC